MIELDRALSSLTKLINECYEQLFPDFPKFPKFSFVRLAATLWKGKVYGRLSDLLLNAFTSLLNSERQELFQQKSLFSLSSSTALDVSCDNREERKLGRIGSCDTDATETSANVEGEFGNDCKACIAASRFIQAIADLSINEIKVHTLGSTKFVMEEPYQSLHSTLIGKSK